MRIAIFSDCYFPVKNGVVTSISELKAGLEAKGHHVIIFTVRHKDYQDTESGIIRFPAIPIGLGTELAFGLIDQSTVNSLVRTHRIDLIHIHTEVSLCVSGIRAARRFSIPRVHTTHTMWEDYRHYVLKGWVFRPGLIKMLAKLSLRGASGLVAPSAKAKDYYQRIVPNVPFEIIPNGMQRGNFDRKDFNSERIKQIRGEWGIDTHDKMIVFVGRIGQEKRVDELFDAILPILRDHTDTKLVFVGDGPRKNALQSKAEIHNLSTQILFTGYVDWESVHLLYCIADLFVTASLSEVHSMTMIEAMMCSLPIVARRDTANVGSVSDGQNGYLADSDEDLADKTKQLLQDGNLRKRFGQTSQKIVERYGRVQHSDKMEAFYRRIIAEHRYDETRNRPVLKNW